MALSEYDIQRIATAIATKLLCDESFLSTVKKTIPRERRMLTTSQAAKMLGLSRKTICEIAPYLGGIRGKGKYSRWVIPEEGLADKYADFKSSR